MANLTESDRATLLSLMYQDDSDDDAPASTAPATGSDLDVSGHRAVLTINGKAVEVPTMAYVRHLEKEIERQNRLIVRLTAAMRTQRTSSATHGNELRDMRRDVDNKLDRRGDFG